jgi:flagellar assembly factor FliW
MPSCQTKFHGTIRFEPEQVLDIPAGLIGFPDEKQFLLLELPSMRPLAFIQSIRTPELCFISLPAQVVDAQYTLSLQPSDVAIFGYRPEKPPVMGKDVLCLALLTAGEKKETTANLLAPVVIDIARHRGMQAIVDAPYSHQHSIAPMELRKSC